MKLWKVEFWSGYGVWVISAMARTAEEAAIKINNYLIDNYSEYRLISIYEIDKVKEVAGGVLEVKYIE